MKEHPILFNGDMVRAILDGRKTQTRRVVMPPRGWDKQFYNKLVAEWSFMGGRSWKPFEENGQVASGDVFCPYGVPGDNLWVRETFSMLEEKILYRADEPTDEKEWQDSNFWRIEKWKPSIHMPRWASRITLEVKNVRVERVQDITEVDALDEGIRIYGKEWIYEHFPEYAHNYAEWDNSSRAEPPLGPSPRMRFEKLWDSINAKRGYSWESNPWVWVVDFEISE